MKTAVSLPDNLFYEAEETANNMGITRSRLFAKAIEDYLNRHNRDKITEKLNNVYSNKNLSEKNEAKDAGIARLQELTKNDTW